MSVIFKCRMEEFDSEDEWEDVDEYDALAAAEQYSEDCDSHSAMETFEGEQERVVLVKDPAGVIRKFLCSRESVPRYNANEIDPKPEPVSDIPI